MKEWRQFELLVERLESLAAPIGAIVKSPDKIRCKITNEPRDVDVSIRYRSFLITVECRRRGRKQDVTWLEQLITKRRNIGADVTIAVSLKGFSENSIQLAAHDGILLRHLNEVTDQEIVSWLGQISTRKWVPWPSLLSLTLLDSKDKQIAFEHLSTNLRKMLEQPDMRGVIIHGKETNQCISLDCLLNHLIRNRFPDPMLAWSLPRHPLMSLRESVVIGLVDDHYYMEGNKKEIQVSSVRLDYSMSMVFGEGTICKVVYYGPPGSPQHEYGVSTIKYENGVTATDVTPKSTYEMLTQGMQIKPVTEL
jgi:hypothetical protein